MHVGLLNWSGHNNLGDDAMTEIIQEEILKRGHQVTNQGESPEPEEVDCYIWGGGTLISGHGIYPLLPIHKPIVGFGIGLGESPVADLKDPNLLFILKKLKGLFLRDKYSYIHLAYIGLKIPITLSYDPIFLIKPEYAEVRRSYVGVNLINSPKVPLRSEELLLDVVKDEDLRYFAICDKEDVEVCKMRELDHVYIDNSEEVIQFLSQAQAAVTTRLHAAVFAYLAGVPLIMPIVYDKKITRFMDYVVKPKVPLDTMREKLNKDLDHALKLLQEAL